MKVIIPAYSKKVTCIVIEGGLPEGGPDQLSNHRAGKFEHLRLVRLEQSSKTVVSIKTRFCESDRDI